MLRASTAKFILWLLGLAFTAWMFVTLKLHYDNLQILDKAVRLIDFGEWTHFGNFGSGVGYLPGTLTTFLSALPMKLYFSPYSAMAVIALFHVISCWLLLKMAELLFPNENLSIVLLVIFWLNPWRVEQAELYNPGYLFLFAAFHFFSAYKMHSNSSCFWTFAHTLNIGLCSQIHFSVLILAIATVVLFGQKRIKVNWLGFVLGVLAFLATLIPYFLSLSERPELALSSHHSDTSYIGRNLILVYPVFKSLLYLLRYGSTYYGRHIFSEINFDYISSETARQSLRIILSAVQWPLALATLYLSLRTLGLFFWRQVRGLGLIADSKTEDGERWFYQYLFSLLIGAVSSAALSPVEFNHWHLILCFPVIAFYMAIKFSRWKGMVTPVRGRLAIYMIIGWFCLQNALAAAGSRSHSLSNNFHQLVLEHYNRH